MFNHPLKYRNDVDFIVFDTETENLNLGFSRPWQLSWVIADKYKIKETHDYYVWINDLSVSKDAAEITRFNYGHYESKAENGNKIWDLFYKELTKQNRIVVGHNILGFDCFQVRNLANYLNVDFNYDWLNNTIDTLALSRAYRFGVNYHNEIPFLAWQFGILNYKQKPKGGSSLGSMIKEFGIEAESSRLHDALYDIEKNYEVFKALISYFEL